MFIPKKTWLFLGTLTAFIVLTLLFWKQNVAPATLRALVFFFIMMLPVQAYLIFGINTDRKSDDYTH